MEENKSESMPISEAVTTETGRIILGMIRMLATAATQQLALLELATASLTIGTVHL